jgi:hypothetical protein
MSTWLQDPKRRRPLSATFVLDAIAISLMTFADRFEVALVGMAIGVVGLLWSRCTLKCRRCDFDVLWWAMRDQPARHFVTSLVALERCPRCAA